jgi:hypothetical protein
VSTVEQKHGDQTSSKATPSHEPAAIEKEVLGHRYSVGWEISIVFETIDQFEIRIRVIEETIESVVPFISELLREFEKGSFVDAVESLESEVIELHSMAPYGGARRLALWLVCWWDESRFPLWKSGILRVCPQLSDQDDEIAEAEECVEAECRNAEPSRLDQRYVYGLCDGRKADRYEDRETDGLDCGIRSTVFTYSESDDAHQADQVDSARAGPGRVRRDGCG